MHRYVSRRAALEEACTRLASLNAPQLPLFRAVADSRIAVIGIYGPEVRWPVAALARLRLPTVVLIGADVDGPEPDRPTEHWVCRHRLRLWARAAIIHGAGGEVEHYRLTVSAAEIERVSLYGNLHQFDCPANGVSVKRLSLFHFWNPRRPRQMVKFGNGWLFLPEQLALL